MRVGNLDATNDLAGIDVRDPSRGVSVRVRTDDVCTASLEVVVLLEEVAGDRIGIPGGVSSSKGMDTGGLEAGMGQVGTKPESLSEGRGGGVSECVCCEARQGQGDGGQTAHGSRRVRGRIRPFKTGVYVTNTPPYRPL